MRLITKLVGIKRFIVILLQNGSGEMNVTQLTKQKNGFCQKTKAK